MNQLKVKRLHPEAVIPKYATAGAACFDLHALLESPNALAYGERVESGAGAATVFRTGLAFEVPPGWVMLIFSRSGHGFKNSVRLSNCVGVIDSDYRGEVQVKLKADEFGGLTVHHGDRIAQAMLVQVPQVQLVDVNELSHTERGTAGFGSTGK